VPDRAGDERLGPAAAADDEATGPRVGVGVPGASELAWARAT